MPKTVKILSIDGGGIRGIIPSMVLAELEARSGKPISAMFDLIAGTSTGGLLAMISTLPNAEGKPKYNAQEFPSLYEKYGSQIFSRTRWDAILSMDNWRVRRYPNTGIQEALTALFGEHTLADTLTDVLVTSYDIERRRPYFFRSTQARTDAAHNFLMRDVVRATTAAPTFFEPALVHGQATENTRLALIDGSMTSINPALCAYIEARERYPEAEDFVVVSIGTGNLTQPLAYQEVRRWGIMNWARPLADIMFDGSSHAVDYQMQRLLPPDEQGIQRYFRLQKRIEGIDHRMDDVSPLSLAMIRTWAAELVEENNDSINMLIDLINEPDALPAKQRRLFPLRSLAFWRRFEVPTLGAKPDNSQSAVM